MDYNLDDLICTKDPMDTTCPICGKNFIPAPQNYYKVDGIRVCSWHCQLRGEREGNHPRKGEYAFKVVLQFDQSGNLLKEFPCAADAGRELKLQAERIRRCCRGDIPHIKGFIFRYKPVEEGEK